MLIHKNSHGAYKFVHASIKNIFRNLAAELNVCIVYLISVIGGKTGMLQFGAIITFCAASVGFGGACLYKLDGCPTVAPAGAPNAAYVCSMATWGEYEVSPGGPAVAVATICGCVMSPRILLNIGEEA